MKRKVFFLFILFVLLVATSGGCTGLNSTLAQSSVIVRAMQDHTVIALKEDIDPTTIKIVFDENASSYAQGSNWWDAFLADGRVYRCNKMYQKDAVCMKRSPKSTAPSAAAGQMKKKRPPHK